MEVQYSIVDCVVAVVLVGVGSSVAVAGSTVALVASVAVPLTVPVSTAVSVAVVVKSDTTVADRRDVDDTEADIESDIDRKSKPEVEMSNR